MKVTLDLDEEAANHILELANSPAVRSSQQRTPEEKVREVLDYTVSAVASGVRRPGSWERGVVEQLFGDWVRL